MINCLLCYAYIPTILYVFVYNCVVLPMFNCLHESIIQQMAAVPSAVLPMYVPEGAPPARMSSQVGRTTI